MLHRLSRALLLSVLLVSALPAAASETPAAPAFTHSASGDWLNTPPLSWADLKGRVVLVEFWTFACSNCIRSQPWLRLLEQKLGKSDFTVVGIHTPELPREYVLANVQAKVREYRITHPVMIDNDYSTWKAWNNRYWPAFYLVDRHGRVRAHYIGETHAGDANATRIEADIARVLSEP